jgi:hypothetical protein
MKTLICWLVLLFPLIYGRHNYFSTFGLDYNVYSIRPGSPMRLFTYRAGVIALVYQTADQGIVVQLQRVDSFERTSPFIVKETAHSHNYRIEACFERGGYSHLFAYDTTLNETIVIRGQEEVAFPLRNYELLRYDYLNDHLYILRNDTLLRYNFDDVMRYNDMGEPSASPLERQKVDEVLSDLLVVGGQQLAIFDQSVNRHLPNGSWAPVMPTKAESFWFQLLPAEAPPTTTHLSPVNIVFIVEILVLFFAVYCLNMKVRLRPQTGTYELSRTSFRGESSHS